MHASVMAWVAGKVSERGLAGGTVLEVGSRIVNGSPRSLFDGEYVGVDMQAGDGVDVVCRADRLPFASGVFDTVVSTETLEHDPYFWKSVVEMARVLRPGGTLLVTARGIGYPHHDFPSDYWRFTVDAFLTLFDFAGLESLEVIPDPSLRHPGVFGAAVKP
jgi:SAM-dependent methyltransferase